MARTGVQARHGTSSKATPARHDSARNAVEEQSSASGAAAAAQANAGGDHMEDEEEHSSKPHAQRRTIFVRSLPTSATTETLTDFFSQSYPIKHAMVVVDPATKQSRGFGFVTFADHEDVSRAIEEFQNSTFDGKKIKIEVAEPRHREQGDAAVAAKSRAAQLKEEREKQRLEARPPKLIIRNLPWSVKTEQDLANLFRSYGKVKIASLPRKNGKLQGFGFVVLRGKKNAEKALEGVNGKEIDGRTLAVDWAVDKAVWEQQTASQEPQQDEEAQRPGAAADSADGSDSEDGGVPVDLESGDERSSEEDDLESEDNEDDEDDSEGEDNDNEGHTRQQPGVAGNDDDDRQACTVFIRNLPWTATDQSLYDHFRQFGPLRYARVVLDHETARPRGTGFVCFWKVEDCLACLKAAPRKTETRDHEKDGSAPLKSHSILEDETRDPTGRYTIEGRILQVSQAVSKTKAQALEQEGASKRGARDHDKRRLFLLSEGTIPTTSPLYQSLSPSEIKLREDSARQRQQLVKTNPMLHLSLTRLSVRNLPRHVDSKALKQLAREAVVGFAKDVKAGVRQPLSKDEIHRGGEAMMEAEKRRKLKGKGIVRQAKIVFESREGSKTDEKSGGGRSRGYGFIEYTTHRSALMGLRWLNGHPITTTAEDGKKKSKRLIVEFAIENAQVVQRRLERESSMQSGDRPGDGSGDAGNGNRRGTVKANVSGNGNGNGNGSMNGKRKRGDGDGGRAAKKGKPAGQKIWPKTTPTTTASSASSASSAPSGTVANSGDKAGKKEKTPKDNQIAMRNRIIAKKRMARRTRKS